MEQGVEDSEPSSDGGGNGRLSRGRDGNESAREDDDGGGVLVRELFDTASARGLAAAVGSALRSSDTGEGIDGIVFATISALMRERRATSVFSLEKKGWKEERWIEVEHAKEVLLVYIAKQGTRTGHALEATRYLQQLADVVIETVDEAETEDAIEVAMEMLEPLFGALVALHPRLGSIAGAMESAVGDGCGVAGLLVERLCRMLNGKSFLGLVQLVARSDAEMSALQLDMLLGKFQKQSTLLLSQEECLPLLASLLRQYYRCCCKINSSSAVGGEAPLTIDLTSSTMPSWKLKETANRWLSLLLAFMGKRVEEGKWMTVDGMALTHEHISLKQQQQQQISDGDGDGGHVNATPTTTTSTLPPQSQLLFSLLRETDADNSGVATLLLFCITDEKTCRSKFLFDELFGSSKRWSLIHTLKVFLDAHMPREMAETILALQWYAFERGMEKESDELQKYVADTCETCEDVLEALMVESLCWILSTRGGAYANEENTKMLSNFRTQCLPKSLLSFTMLESHGGHGVNSDAVADCMEKRMAEILLSDLEGITVQLQGIMSASEQLAHQVLVAVDKKTSTCKNDADRLRGVIFMIGAIFTTDCLDAEFAEESLESLWSQYKQYYESNLLAYIINSFIDNCRACTELAPQMSHLYATFFLARSRDILECLEPSSPAAGATALTWDQIDHLLVKGFCTIIRNSERLSSGLSFVEQLSQIQKCLDRSFEWLTSDIFVESALSGIVKGDFNCVHMLNTLLLLCDGRNTDFYSRMCKLLVVSNAIRTESSGQVRTESGLGHNLKGILMFMKEAVEYLLSVDFESKPQKRHLENVESDAVGLQEDGSRIEETLRCAIFNAALLLSGLDVCLTEEIDSFLPAAREAYKTSFKLFLPSAAAANSTDLLLLEQPAANHDAWANLSPLDGHTFPYSRVQTAQAVNILLLNMVLKCMSNYSEIRDFLSAHFPKTTRESIGGQILKLVDPACGNVKFHATTREVAKRPVVACLLWLLYELQGEGDKRKGLDHFEFVSSTIHESFFPLLALECGHGAESDNDASGAQTKENTLIWQLIFDFTRIMLSRSPKLFPRYVGLIVLLHLRCTTALDDEDVDTLVWTAVEELMEAPAAFADILRWAWRSGKGNRYVVDKCLKLYLKKGPSSSSFFPSPPPSLRRDPLSTWGIEALDDFVKSGKHVGAEKETINVTDGIFSLVCLSTASIDPKAYHTLERYVGARKDGDLSLMLTRFYDSARSRLLNPCEEPQVDIEALRSLKAHREKDLENKLEKKKAKRRREGVTNAYVAAAMREEGKRNKDTYSDLEDFIVCKPGRDYSKHLQKKRKRIMKKKTIDVEEVDVSQL